jgi:hypothetical protein
MEEVAQAKMIPLRSPDVVVTLRCLKLTVPVLYASRCIYATRELSSVKETRLALTDFPESMQ